MADLKTLGDELPKKMAYVRDTVIPAYERIGTPAMFALVMIRAQLDAAARAMAEGDVVEMVRAYKALDDIKL